VRTAISLRPRRARRRSARCRRADAALLPARLQLAWTRFEHRGVARDPTRLRRRDHDAARMGSRDVEDRPASRTVEPGRSRSVPVEQHVGAEPPSVPRAERAVLTRDTRRSRRCRGRRRRPLPIVPPGGGRRASRRRSSGSRTAGRRSRSGPRASDLTVDRASRRWSRRQRGRCVGQHGSTARPPETAEANSSRDASRGRPVPPSRRRTGPLPCAGDASPPDLGRLEQFPAATSLGYRHSSTTRTSGRRPGSVHVPDHSSPGSRTPTSTPSASALGGQVIGSTARLRRRCPAGRVSPV
jgi:hypothetical protein